MKEPSKQLRHRSASEQTTEESTQSAEKTGSTKFETAESMIRHDAGQTEVPEVIETRLKKSLRDEPPHGSWWSRIFSK